MQKPVLSNLLGRVQSSLSLGFADAEDIHASLLQLKYLYWESTSPVLPENQRLLSQLCQSYIAHDKVGKNCIHCEKGTHMSFNATLLTNMLSHKLRSRHLLDMVAAHIRNAAGIESSTLACIALLAEYNYAEEVFWRCIVPELINRSSCKQTLSAESCLKVLDAYGKVGIVVDSVYAQLEELCLKYLVTKRGELQLRGTPQDEIASFMQNNLSLLQKHMRRAF